MELKEIQVLTKVGGWSMNHLPSEMTKLSYTFGQGGNSWGPIPSDQVTEGMDVEGSAFPRPMTLEEAIEDDQESICYFSSNPNPEKLKESIDFLQVHRNLRKRNWKGLIPTDIIYCEQLRNQLRDRCQPERYCSYQLEMEQANSLGVGDDGRIYALTSQTEA